MQNRNDKRKTAIECPNLQALPALSGVLRQGTLSAPSIVWELSGEPCETRDQALSGIKNNTEAFIICSRGDEFLQATCNSPENYHCEISFAGGKGRELYMTPKDLDYSRLHDLFSRYAAGEDLSHLKKEWTLDAHKPGYITAIVVVLAIIAVLAVIIFSS